MTIANLVPRSRVYTSERDAIILRDYPAGVSRADILAAICALPGPPPANERAIKLRAQLLGVRRPAGWGEGDRGVWPAERSALVPALYTDARVSWDDMLARLNDGFPHLPPVTVKGVQNKARKMGLRRPAIPINQRKPTGLTFLRQVGLDQPMQPNLPPTLEARLEKAAKMLAGKGRDFHVWSVVAHTGLEAWQVCMVAGRVAMGLPVR